MTTISTLTEEGDFVEVPVSAAQYDLAHRAMRGDYFNDPFREAAGLALHRAQTHSEPPTGVDDLYPERDTDADRHRQGH